MKISKVLLRWYKSFNICYRFTTTAKAENESHPWDSINVGQEIARDYPFIEIPVEQDITTIVGGNESGKSHLLSAICKVINGKGLTGEPFAQTDFCRYATVPSLSTTRWPNIGLQFRVEKGDDIKPLLAKFGVSVSDGLPKLLTLILGYDDADTRAYLYFDSNDQLRKLQQSELDDVRKLLPMVRYINANSALPDHLRLAELLAGCGLEVPQADFRISNTIAQKIANAVFRLASPQPTEQVGALAASIESMKKDIAGGKINISDDAALAAKLFTEVLGISPTTLSEVLGQPPSQRGYIQYFLKDWNDQIFEKLDLAHFWQQDDQATLELVFKDDTLYFDITDKTDATYTFKERSSGLRYFLSYYIQAKALEIGGKNSNSVIVMDEPDSFLSILGQRNMLAVFESLVGFESSRETSQVIYTTHSPFLINRHFPRRIRVVTKEEAEEGTQYSTHGASRRYEPVRSALGIDCAQTLFMGAANVVLEGLTDQFLLTEVSRTLAASGNLHDLLDLNAIVAVSADGVFNVEKILSASQWGDEPIPATTVLLDGDDAGRSVANIITGQAEGKPKLIDQEFVILLDEKIHDSLRGNVITIEDLIPPVIYSQAFQGYIKRWYPIVHQNEASKLETYLRQTSNTRGNVARIKELCGNINGLNEDYDKLGVLQYVIELLRDSLLKHKDGLTGDMKTFTDRVLAVFRRINETVDASRRNAAKRSMATNVKRIVREFLRTRTEGSSIMELRRHVHRLIKEGRTTDEVGERLRMVLEKMDSDALHLEQSGQGRVTGDSWQNWVKRLELVKRNPLDPQVLTPQVAND